MLELLIPAIVAAPAGIIIGANELTNKVCRTSTPYSADEWATLWQEKRDRLADISLGLDDEPVDEVLDELVNILLVSGRRLKKHGTPNRFRDFDRNYQNMALTNIAWESQGTWYSSTTYVHKKSTHNNASLKDDVTGLRRLSELARELDSSPAKWHQELEEFAREYGAHLLLNYRASPTSVAPVYDETFEVMRERQKVLNQKRRRLVLEGENLLSTASPLANEGLQKAIAIAKELPRAIEAKPKLALEALTEDERQVVQGYHTLRQYLTKEQRITAERYLEKIAVSVEAAAKAETYPEEARKAILALTNENRALATAALTDLVVTGSANTNLSEINALEGSK